LPLDLDLAREKFESSQDFTIGLEEEFAILNPQTLELEHRFEDVFAACQQDEVLAEAAAGELIASEVEIRSGRSETFAEAAERQRERRARLFEVAGGLGLALGAMGTHPWANYLDQRIIDTPHYNRLRQELGWVAQRNNTWSLHLHMGIKGADRAIAVCDWLRELLPLLLAASANSPFLDGRDTGLHSVRSEIFTRTFPRCGVPSPFRDWKTYADFIDTLVRVGSVVESTQLWWSVRPHHSFGTVEVRICDAQMTATESDGLAALIVACVRRAAEEVDAGETPPDLPGRLIEENFWRAIRYGLDGRLLDLERDRLDRIQEFPAAETLDRLKAWSGSDAVLPELNGAQRQRRLIEAGATPAEVYAECLRETQSTYAEEPVR
jgi:glutamate---cysteine ligase / carboxylate-amine ligase